MCKKGFRSPEQTFGLSTGILSFANSSPSFVLVHETFEQVRVVTVCCLQIASHHHPPPIASASCCDATAKKRMRHRDAETGLVFTFPNTNSRERELAISRTAKVSACLHYSHIAARSCRFALLLRLINWTALSTHNHFDVQRNLLRLV